MLRSVAAVGVVLAGLAAVTFACTSSTSAPAADGGVSADATAIDAPVVPLVCGLPLPATCPTSAPCAFASWGCPPVACDGTFVVTDGAWVYFYSSAGGELVGEVPAADAGLVECPYGFQPPLGCTPAVASACSADGAAPAPDASGAEGGAPDVGAADAGSPGDATDEPEVASQDADVADAVGNDASDGA